MKDGTGILDTCLAEAQQLGGIDLDTLWCSVKNRTQKGSSCSAEVGLDGNGNFHDEVTDMKHRWSQVGPLLHWNNKVSLGLKELMGRSSTPATVLSQAMRLCAPATAAIPAEEWPAGEAFWWDWRKRWPRAPEGHRGQRCKGEPCMSGRPTMCEARGFKGEPPSAFSRGLGLPGLWSQLSVGPPAWPEGLPEDETRCAFPVSRVNGWPQENSSKWQKYLKWSADSIGDIGTAVFKLALCHS